MATHVQSAKNSTSGATSLAKAYASAVASGNRLVCIAGSYSGSASFSCSDTGGGSSWVVIPNINNVHAASIGNTTVAMWTKVAVGGTPTVTVSTASSVPIDLIILEYSSATGWEASPIVASSSNYNDSGTSMTTGAATPSSATCLLVAVGYDATGYRSGMAAGTDGQGHTMTARQHCQNPDDEGMMASDVSVTSAAAFNCTFTGVTSGDTWLAGFAALAETAGGAAPGYIHGKELPAGILRGIQRGMIRRIG